MDDALNHFTDVDHCSRDQLEDLIQLAMAFSDDPAHFENTRRGKLLVNLFYEASTRTLNMWHSLCF